MLIGSGEMIIHYPLTKMLMHVKLAMFIEATLSHEGVF